MRYLLDTHVWIWGLLEPTKLHKPTVTLLEDQNNILLLSAISVWETLILIEKNRLEVKGAADAWVKAALQRSNVRPIMVTHTVAFRSRQIELPHQDPADRFIAATALEYRLPLITADAILLKSSQITTISA